MLQSLGYALYHDQYKRKLYFLDYSFKQKMSSVTWKFRSFPSNWVAFVHLQFMMLLGSSGYLLRCFSLIFFFSQVKISLLQLEHSPDSGNHLTN